MVQCAVYFSPELQRCMEFGPFTVVTQHVTDLDADVTVRELVVSHAEVSMTCHCNGCDFALHWLPHLSRYRLQSSDAGASRNNRRMLCCQASKPQLAAAAGLNPGLQAGCLTMAALRPQTAVVHLHLTRVL